MTEDEASTCLVCSVVRRLSSAARLTDHVRQQPEETGALNRARELALPLGGNRSDTARHDLAALGNVALQQPHVLVVDLRRIGAGKRAGLAAAKEWAALAGLRAHWLS